MRWIDHHAVHPSFFRKISPLAHQAMKSILFMLSKRLNLFQVCSASDEIIFVLAQHAFGCPCKNLSKFERWLSIRIKVR
jgi:hypothetical protein